MIEPPRIAHLPNTPKEDIIPSLFTRWNTWKTDLLRLSWSLVKGSHKAIRHTSLYPVHSRTDFSVSAPPKNVARKLFRFGSRNKKFSRHNEKLLVPVFQKTHATIGAFSVRILYPCPRPFSIFSAFFAKFLGAMDAIYPISPQIRIKNTH